MATVLDNGTKWRFIIFILPLMVLMFAYQTNCLPKDNAFKRVIKGDSMTHILLMLRAESTYRLDDVLLDIPPCPDMFRSNTSLVRQGIESDYYGSGLLDQWREHTPVNVTLKLTNYQGTTLWSSTFQVTDRNTSRLETWFRTENIVRLPDYTQFLESPSTLTTRFGTPGFLALLQQTSTNITAHVGIIQQADNVTSCSKIPSFFYFSNSTMEPFKIRNGESTHFEYIGCYNLLSVYGSDDYPDLPNVTQCHQLCASRGYRTFGFFKTNGRCHCIGKSTWLVSSGAKEENCDGIAGYEMSDFRTANVPLTQTEVIIKRASMIGGNETRIYFGNTTTGFVTSVHVYNYKRETGSSKPCQYRLQYSRVDCDGDKYLNIGVHRVYNCDVKEPLRKGVLRMKCLVIILPDIVSADIDVYGIEEPYIAAPVLMILGHYDYNPLSDNETASRNKSEVSVKPTPSIATKTISTTLTILKTETVSSTTTISALLPSYSTTPGSDDKSKACCFCDCSMYTAFQKWHMNSTIVKIDNTSIASVTNQLKANLTVNTTSLSSYIRAKTCAPDPRPVVRYMGSFGLLLLVLVLSCVILADISSFRTHIRTIRQGIHNNRCYTCTN
ncbi:uncharacterized protein [Argopecten irradians]|uniref:uncharacterized protein n=1 Tax=Argopecten irradians TaxID=31199 RepID=UPI00371C6F7A